MFEWIEAFYIPTRRHTALGNLSPADYETLHTRRNRGMINTQEPSGKPGQAPFVRQMTCEMSSCGPCWRQS